MTSLISFFFMLCILHFSPLTNCTSLPNRLNHSETKQAIENFMAFDASQLEEEEEESSPPPTFSSMSIPMYDIDIFIKSSHKDYHSLILSRLARDANRVDWLIFMLASSSPQIDIPYYYENSMYVGIMNVGTPPQRAHLLVDTGSYLAWWDCKPCKYCPSYSYEPSRSSSYREVDCRRKDECPDGVFEGCDLNDKNRCKFKMIYIDGTVPKGILAYEKVETTRGETMIENILFGCVNTAPGSFIGRKYTGLLGFGPSGYSIVSQMNATSFSFCPKTHTATVSTTLSFNDLPIPNFYTMRIPFVRNIPQVYYSVSLLGVYVGSEFLRMNQSEQNADSRIGAVIDSGTAISRFPQEFYDKFRDAFRRHTRSIESLPKEDFLDSCYNISSTLYFLDVPQIKYVFSVGGKDVEPLGLDDNQTLIPIGTDGKYCLAFAPTPASRNFTIIGTWQLQGTRVSFDLPNQMLQIDPGNCL